MGWRERIGWLAIGVLAAIGIVVACHDPNAALGAQLSVPCPVTGAGPYQSCTLMPDSATPQVGQQVTAGAGDPGTPWMVTDHNGAPMAWVNLYGLYSGGDWGKMPGGLICVTNGTTAMAACLTPTGKLELFTRDGHKEVLSPKDIAWIHAHGG